MYIMKLILLKKNYNIIHVIINLLKFIKLLKKKYNIIHVYI